MPAAANMHMATGVSRQLLDPVACNVTDLKLLLICSPAHTVMSCDKAVADCAYAA